MPRQKHISPEKRAEQEAAQLHEAIRKYADAYNQADEALLGSLNPRTQKWQIAVLNRGCEILDEHAALLHARSNGNGKSPANAWWSPIPDNIIGGSAEYRDVTEAMRLKWARERNDEIQQRIDQAFERGKREAYRELNARSFWERLRQAIRPT